MKNAKRFVFDTNVLVSAVLFPVSIPALALKKAITIGTVIVSEDCLDELSRVIMDERFEKYSSFSKRQMFLLDFENAAEFIGVKNKIILSRDPDDDKFLSLAKAGSASAIITGDDDLLVLRPLGSISILTPSDFMKLY